MAGWVKQQPDYPAIVKFLAKAKGQRTRRRAIVAVARQLAIDLWRINTGRASAQEVGLSYERPAPGGELPRSAIEKPESPGRKEPRPKPKKETAKEKTPGQKTPEQPRQETPGCNPT